MKSWMLCATSLILLGSLVLPGSAQPILDPGVSRPMTETELESIAPLWRLDPPIPEMGLDPILEHSFAVHLAGFGNVYFLSALDQNPQELVYSHILIEGHKVRWELPQSEQVTPSSYRPYSLDAVVFTELNFDGLTDIYTIASYVTGMGQMGAIPFPVTTLYEQQEDGTFVILEAESIEISSRGVSTVAEVEKILRDELYFLP